MTSEEAWDDLAYMMCDKCLYRVETDPSVPIADLCDRCRKRILDALFGALDDAENLP